jgi:hypothetical protein
MARALQSLCEVLDMSSVIVNREKIARGLTPIVPLPPTHPSVSTKGLVLIKAVFKPP